MTAEHVNLVERNRGSFLGRRVTGVSRRRCRRLRAQGERRHYRNCRRYREDCPPESRQPESGIATHVHRLPPPPRRQRYGVTRLIIKANVVIKLTALFHSPPIPTISL
jgi:hypothetical protein